MTIKRRVVANDGLDIVESIDVIGATGEEMREALKDISGADGVVGEFERTIADIERWWRKKLPSAGTPEARPLTLEAYARDIVRDIAQLRRAIAQHPELEPLVLVALDLGTQIEDAHWRFERGEHVRRHVKIVTTNRASAKKPRPRGNSVSDEDIARIAGRLHRETPGQPDRWYAREVARCVRLPFGTVRRRLEHLKRR